MTTPTSHRPRAARWFTAGVCALVLAGCGSDDPAVDDAQATDDAAEDAAEEPDAEEPDAADADESADTGSGTEIALRDDDGFAFEPAEVSVSVGETVTWVHEGSISHTVTADDDSFDSGTLAAGDTFEVTFDEPGSYPYTCDLHGSMQGTVTVE